MAEAATHGARTARLDAMLSVSRRVAAAGDLGTTLAHIAHEAVGVVGARAASIVLIGPGNRLRLAGASGLSSRYCRTLARGPRLASSTSPSSLAIAAGRPVVVADILTDARLAAWHRSATAEGYRAVVSAPLTIGDRPVGALNVYGDVPAEWAAADVELLTIFADHAAIAVRIADLIDRQSRQLDDLARMADELREQTHEHANRIHSIGALVALGEHDEAQRFVAQLLSREPEPGAAPDGIRSRARTQRGRRD